MKDEKNVQISILILCYNGAEDTLEAIESLKNQRAFIDQIYVMDNASNNESVGLLRLGANKLNFKLIESSINLGFAGGFNKLFKDVVPNLKTEYVCILNNDVIAEESFLPKLMVELNPEAILCPMILWNHDKETVIQSAGSFDKTMMKMKNTFAGKNRKDVQKKTHLIESCDGCCFIIHKKWLENGVSFDDNYFMYFEDMNFFHELKKYGLTFKYVAESVLYHKEYGSSGERNTPSALRNYYFYRNRMYFAKKIHRFPKRLLTYYRLIRLAREKYKLEKPKSIKAANSIYKGVYDFFIGRMGKGNY